MKIAGPGGTSSRLLCQVTGLPLSASARAAARRARRWPRRDGRRAPAKKSGRPRGGAQGVGHQRAAPRPELDQPDARRRADLAPDFGRPQADQFAEHLRDFRRGDEIAVGAERIARGVIALGRMGQGERHVALDRDRPFVGDDFADVVLERWRSCCVRSCDSVMVPPPPNDLPRAGRGARNKQSRTTPSRTSGAESSMPMVAPPNRKPSCGSGSRKNSQKMRATP